MQQTIYMEKKMGTKLGTSHLLQQQMSNGKEKKVAQHSILGIDYGSKTAGTTALAWIDKKGQVHFKQSDKNQNADTFILEHIAQLNTELIGLDAPLSIPKGLLDLNNDSDCFYRDADKKLGAMSPLFLGGLTARAIALKKVLMKQKIAVFETYPAAFIKYRKLSANYVKKEPTKITDFIEATRKEFPFEIPETKSWHVIDACICLAIALNINEQQAQFEGNTDERIWY